jgi:hypothetical protein
MKSLRIAILLLLCTFYAARAQKNYKPATLVKTSGDTIKGYINYKEWDETPKIIEFKASPDDAKPQRYTAETLRSFEITGIDKYLGYTGNISIDKNNFPNIADALDTTTVRDTVFLQQVYRGRPLSLFRHKDKIKNRFFISEGGAEPVELKLYQFYATVGNPANNSNVQQFKIYQDTLLALAQKYNPSKNLEARIMKIDFTQSELFSVIKLINNDKGTKESGIGGTRLYAGVLFVQTTTDFLGANRLGGQRSQTYIPTVNAGLDVFINKYTKRLFLRLDLSLSVDKPHFKFQEENLDTYDYKFDRYTVTLSPQLLYNLYNKESFKLYLGVGVGVDCSFYGKDNRIIYNTTYGYTKTEKNPYNLNRFAINPLIKAGSFIGKKFEIYAQYTPPDYITNYVDFGVRTSALGIGVHYLFN